MLEIHSVRKPAATNPNSGEYGKIFDRVWGKDFYPDQKSLMVKYAFDVRVVVAKTMSPRHPSFYPFLEVGMDLIERTMACIPLNCEKATFYFPERWLAVVEQREFMFKLETTNMGLNLKKADILTSSPIMISDFFQEQILIIA